MAAEEISLAYDAAARSGVLTFPNGKQLKISNVTEEQAREFVRKNGAEFQRRDCVLHTDGVMLTREGGPHG
jgi:hypothetical protein